MPGQKLGTAKIKTFMTFTVYLFSQGIQYFRVLVHSVCSHREKSSMYLGCAVWEIKGVLNASAEKYRPMASTKKVSTHVIYKKVSVHVIYRKVSPHAVYKEASAKVIYKKVSLPCHLQNKDRPMSSTKNIILCHLQKCIAPLSSTRKYRPCHLQKKVSAHFIYKKVSAHDGLCSPRWLT